MKTHREINRLSDQDFDQDRGNPLGAAVVAAAIIAFIVGCMYEFSKLF